MTRNKKLGDCPILFAECVAVREAILTVIQQGFPRTIIYSDSQVLINANMERLESQRIS